MLYLIALVQNHPLCTTASKTSKVSRRSTHEHSTTYKPIDTIYDVADTAKEDEAACWGRRFSERKIGIYKVTFMMYKLSYELASSRTNKFKQFIHVP